MKVLDIKGIIFDYGGTLDTRGDHWSEVLWQGYEHFGIGVADDEEVEPGAVSYTHLTLPTSDLV